MNKRQQRHEAIRALIRENRISTHQEMTERLCQLGFNCTQATVSRDIVELGLEKSTGKYYVLPEEVRLRQAVASFMLTVQAAGNILVVKTRPGCAGSVADALDDASIEGVIGSVAGDDTILLVTGTPEQAITAQGAIEALAQ